MNTNTNSSNPPTQWRRAVALAAIIAVTGSTFVIKSWATQAEGGRNIPVDVQVDHTPVARDGKLATSYAPVVKRVAPSVVKISITTEARLTSSPNLDIPELRRFFGDGESPFGRMRESRSPKEHGVGSGVIVSQDGYILTNNHVVDHADEIQVSFNDGREMTAKVLGKDPKTDVALIKVDAKDLPAITLGDSEQIEVGDVVLAIGNPFGIGQTVTTGIISATGRATLGLDYEDFIQTDAAINPGNSGGALVDAEGRLIGINTAILSRSGGNQGIGFAVPVNLARWVMDSLVKNGRVERGFLGVNIQDLTPTLAKEFGRAGTQGALVSEVTPKSPAAKAGLQSGDVITEFNGKAVADSRHLKLQVGATVPGSAVPVKIERGGKDQVVNVTLEELPNDKVADATPADRGDAEDALHGVAVEDLNRAMRSRLDLPPHLEGAVVTQVEEDSPAYESGLREGDVITEINRKPIRGAEDAVRACEHPSDKHTLVKVWSHGGSRFLVVDESKAG